MIRQAVKDIYMQSVRFASLPGGVLARFQYRRSPAPEGHYLHLGCGEHYIKGMINIDGNITRRKDLWWDLRNRLPFGSGTAAFVYCSHTLEHFYPDDALQLLREIRRVLSPAGTCRVVVPSLEYALRIASGEAASNWPRAFADPMAQALNYLFCDGQHRYGYSLSLLTEFAKQAGFSRVIDRSATSGVSPVTYGRVTVGDEPVGSLVVELSP